MFYYRFWADTEYCGTREEEYVSYETEPTDEEVEEDCSDWAESIFESYDYLATGWVNDLTEEEKEEALESYYENCCCGWDEITKEEYENEEIN